MRIVLLCLALFLAVVPPPASAQFSDLVRHTSAKPFVGRWTGTYIVPFVLIVRADGTAVAYSPGSADPQGRWRWKFDAKEHSVKFYNGGSLEAEAWLCKEPGSIGSYMVFDWGEAMVMTYQGPPPPPGSE